MSQENHLLLKEYSGFKDAYQLVLKEIENENNTAEYYIKLLERNSKKKLQNILEIYPENEESYQVALRKNGYDVTSIALDMRISAVGGEQDGDHFIIGKDFNFPSLKQKFDAVLITHGCFGKFVSLTKTNEFLKKLYDQITIEGILLCEFWHLPGVEKSVTDKKGLKDWEKINSGSEGSIIRLTNSKLHLDSSILSVDIHYLIDKENELKRFNESHVWRLYTISELDLLLTSSNFQLVKTFKFLTFDEPEFISFRLLGVCEKT